MKKLFCVAALVGALIAAVGTPPSAGVRFTDVSGPAGIKFVHNAGKTGKKYLPETMGSGVAFLDADGDGWVDILLVNSKDWTPRGRRSTAALYRNNHDGTFTDVTRGSGLDIEMFGMGVAFADYDNDGRQDVYITALEGDRLFHNEGNFKFRDVTAASGIRNANFGTSAAWFDYDRDGKVDLFVANYVQWTQKGDLWCSLDGATKSYCTPESYKGTSSRLFHNLGNGKFEDVTQKAGIGDTTSKALGVAVLDYNGDGWPDLFVTNDTQPNKLYRNNHGTFSEEAIPAGVAYGEDGTARGAAYADFDHDGDLDVIVSTNGGPAYLFRNDGGNRNNWIHLTLTGAKSNRSAIGAVVRIESAGGKQWQMVHSGSSYCSQSELGLTFGLGKDPKVNTIDVEWPSGQKQHIANVTARQYLNITEPR